jgi:putative transposase
VHLPIEEQNLAAIRRASATGLPYGDENWVQQLAKKLNLDLTIRPRGRPRKAETDK